MSVDARGSQRELNHENLAKSNSHLAHPTKNALSEPRRIRASSACLAIMTSTKTCCGLSKPAWPIPLGKHKANIQSAFSRTLLVGGRNIPIANLFPRLFRRFEQQTALLVVGLSLRIHDSDRTHSSCDTSTAYKHPPMDSLLPIPHLRLKLRSKLHSSCSSTHPFDKSPLSIRFFQCPRSIVFSSTTLPKACPKETLEDLCCNITRKLVFQHILMVLLSVQD